MDKFLVDSLVTALNVVKSVYDLAQGNDEVVLRPLMQGAMEVATILQIPYETTEDGLEIEEWGTLTAERVEILNEKIRIMFKGDDAS